MGRMRQYAAQGLPPDLQDPSPALHATLLPASASARALKTPCAACRPAPGPHCPLPAGCAQPHPWGLPGPQISITLVRAQCMAQHTHCRGLRIYGRHTSGSCFTSWLPGSCCCRATAACCSAEDSIGGFDLCTKPCSLRCGASGSAEAAAELLSLPWRAPWAHEGLPVLPGSTGDCASCTLTAPKGEARGCPSPAFWPSRCGQGASNLSACVGATSFS